MNKLIEQILVWGGQASQTVDSQCRLNVLLRFTRNPKKCKDILVGNDALLRRVGWTGPFSLRSGSQNGLVPPDIRPLA